MAFTVVHDIDNSPAGFPDIDPAYALDLRSTDTIHVEYTAEPNDDGSEIVIRRMVSLKARTMKARKIVWVEDCVVLPRGTAPDLVRDIVASLAA
jgi:hypothetical protein